MGKKIVFMLLCSISCLGISAQKTATVKNFTQTTDHISANDRRNDLNGNPCALVKVQVVDEVTRVEGNKIGNIVDKGVEKWVYMCKGSRNMRVHLKNHLPVKVMFQDYGISGLESNRVYELVIETPNNASTTSSQKLIMNYSPTHAMVLIDSKPYKGNGRIEIVLPIGEHKYIIAADGYNTAEGVVKLNEMGVREITEHLTADNAAVIHQSVVNEHQTIDRQAELQDFKDSYKDQPRQSEESHQELPYKKTSKNNVSGLKPGFKGYVEIGYALGLNDDDDGCGLARAAFGYQFNSHIFTGLGVGVGLYDEFDDFGIPVFANFRYTILNKRISPFVDAKAGYSFGDMEGLYLSPSIGCRFAIGKRMAITTSVCLEMQDYEYEDWYYEYWFDDFYYYRHSESETALSLGLKIGFEF